MNILIVCDYFLDYLGGAQTAIAAEVAALRQAGHRVTIVAPRRTRESPTDENESFFSPIVLPGLDLAVVANCAKTRERLAGLLARLSIDVVHVHSEFGLAVAAIQVAADAGVPSFHTVHTFYWRSGLRSSRLLAWLIRILHHLVTGLPAPMVRLCDNDVDNAVRGMTLTVARSAGTVVSPSAHQAVDLRAAGVRVVATVANCVPPEPVRSHARWLRSVDRFLSCGSGDASQKSASWSSRRRQLPPVRWLVQTDFRSPS